MNASESTPLSGYGIRACRAAPETHWHVTSLPTGEDVITNRGFKFLDINEALNEAARMNREQSELDHWNREMPL